MTGARIVAVGTALPEKVVTNDDLAQYLDTSDEWITERTGIRERRIGGTTGELATEAGRAALKNAGLSGDDIDLVVLATSTPDQAMPPTATVVQAALDVRGGAMDMNVACSGFVYALAVAHGMILGGMKNVLVIGADTLSSITDQQDRTTAVLFADGAGAVVLSAAEEDSLLASDLGSKGELHDILQADLGGHIKMAGKEVYRQAVLLCVKSITDVCEQAGVKPSDIDLFVAHQANTRIIDAVTDRLGMERERSAIVLDRTGNTSAASVPLALADAVQKNQVKDGDLVAFCGFGAGMAWATQLWRWNTK
jgi:3-oxoacyl-[acyl-carrier-protein] synthase-3